ncbi:4023_t:CDS:1 [Funneliformis geosporum]|uniref:8248_t:CDS:1 n=1 Tax=Funneliformis geosporum TaxID=1117311 RepID=A0A9W4SGH9_9GLOM|nr:4023_t:CDS:1 [Funneliformis geosporum]CAI2168209.1 8248_t:CDS:1 [Funneliformis geosporum]
MSELGIAQVQNQESQRFMARSTARIRIEQQQKAIKEAGANDKENENCRKKFERSPDIIVLPESSMAQKLRKRRDYKKYFLYLDIDAERIRNEHLERNTFIPLENMPKDDQLERQFKARIKQDRILSYNSFEIHKLFT